MGLLRIQFDASKFDKIVRDVKNARSNIQQGMTEAMLSSLFEVHAKAVLPGYVPYKTGTLRRSITFILRSSPGRLEGAVGSNLVYAAIQEFGGDAGRNKSVHITGKRYLTRAIEETKQTRVERFRKIQILKKR